MGIGCVLLLWGILAAIAAAVAVIGAAIFVVSGVKRSKLGTLVGGLMGVAGGVVALGAVVFIGSWLVWGMWPHETTSRGAFKDAFGRSAGAEVTQIRSWTQSSTDSHVQYLRFHAPPSTIAAISRTRFTVATARTCEEDALMSKNRAPEWWTPSVTPRTQCYAASPYDGQFAVDSAVLHYDASTGEAFFHYSGVD